jgi:ABC-2 type transport system ATP-binding protein
LLGPNGCGKTTTIGMILGLLKPSKGRILIDNQDIEKNRINVLKKINFISPYIELSKKTYCKTKFVYLWKTIWC